MKKNGIYFYFANIATKMIIQNIIYVFRHIILSLLYTVYTNKKKINIGIYVQF